jgi:hypothetical protein
MPKYKVQWRYWQDWSDCCTGFENTNVATEYLEAMQLMWPLHQFRMVWYRVAKQAA